VGALRSVRREGRTERESVQTYRWKGAVRRKAVRIGAGRRVNLAALQQQVDQQIWDSTYLPFFDAIKGAIDSRNAIAPKSLVEKEFDQFVLEFTYNTNRIEGSSLSLWDTRELLEREVVPRSKPLRDVLEARAHAGLFRRLIADPEPMDLDDLLRWHRALFGETKPDLAGQLRTVQVWIGGSKHVPPPPLEVRPMLIELLRRTSRDRPAVHPVQLAAEFHLRFESIHPFADGNGRIGRLAMNLLLARGGFPMADILYSKRKRYYAALERSNVLGSSRPFLHWFFLRYSREHRRILAEGS
jgi:Fic family protein